MNQPTSQEQKNLAEIELLKSKKAKTDLERKELENEISKKWYRKERTIQAVIAGVIALPLFWFFFNSIIIPSSKIDIIEQGLELAEQKELTEIKDNNLDKALLDIKEKENELLHQKLIIDSINVYLNNALQDYEKDTIEFRNNQARLEKKSEKLTDSIYALNKSIKLTTDRLIAEAKRNSLYPDNNFLPNIYFDKGKSIFTPANYQNLATVASYLNSNPKNRLEVIGHTGVTGTEAYNQNLSERMAKAVIKSLVNDFGIDESRMTIMAKGESEPISKMNDVNNRVEFKIL